jgi:hypothetical protein
VEVYLMAETSPHRTHALIRSPKEIAPLIKIEDYRAQHAAKEAAMPHYVIIGGLLLEAQEGVPDGEWGTWLKRNFKYSQATANDYMRMARIAASKNTSMRARPATSGPPPSIRQTLRPEYRRPDLEAAKASAAAARKLNFERLAQDQQARATEARLTRDLILQAFDLGFKILAHRLHPDRPGGSHQAMTRLNTARRIVRSRF